MGRTSETYGDDPFLVSRMGVAYVKGMQADKTDGVACIAKHFLGYAETQGGAELRGRPHWGPGVVRDLCHPL